jgi:hypothetical protein
MNLFGIETIFTIIKVITGFAFETWPSNRIHEAAITAYALMTTRHYLHLCYNPSPVALLWEIYTDISSITAYVWNSRTPVIMSVFCLLSSTWLEGLTNF